MEADIQKKFEMKEPLRQNCIIETLFYHSSIRWCETHLFFCTVYMCCIFKNDEPLKNVYIVILCKIFQSKVIVKLCQCDV